MDGHLADERTHFWPPYTAIDAWETQDPAPPMIDRAQGIYLYPREGPPLIDAVGSWWVSNLGHGHPRVIAAMRDQLDRMPHVTIAGLRHEPASTLARRLVGVAPAGLSRVFYSDNGSTALEVALRATFQYWHQNGRPERTRFLTLNHAYHGDTLGTVAIGAIPLFHRIFKPLLFETTVVPSPAAPDGSNANVDYALDALRRALEDHGDTYAALVLEPLVQGAAGMLMYPPSYLREARALCDAHDVFLIADEVFTGFGRTGALFACELANITPDVLCLSKGLTGGTMPFAATLTTERIFDGFRGTSDRTFFYGHSYCANPLGCAAALAVLDAFEHDGILEHVALLGPTLQDGLEAIRALPNVDHIRRTGLIAAIQLGDRADYALRSGHAVARRALELGVYLRPLGNVIYLVPALTIQPDELSTLLERTHEAIRRAEADGVEP